MAPYPEEIDVFSVPHSRMKQLVHVYCEKLTCTDFTDYVALESLLHELHQTFCEFRSHEQIENQYIMKKLKNRLKSLSIHDAAVCNCHSDNRLSDMLALVEDGYSCTSKPESERINFGIKLQNALDEFTGLFLPHMKEEEEVFQPMLIKYFEYEELKCLKEKVIQEHCKWRAYDSDKEKVSLEEEESDQKEDDQDNDDGKNYLQLPPEILSHIFCFLTPQDLLCCSEVSRQWYDVSHSPALWRNFYPCHWAHGIWDAYELNCDHLIELMCAHSSYFYDEDADIDESCDSEHSSSIDADNCGVMEKLLRKEVKTLTSVTKHLLPKVGSGVQKLILTSCKGLTSSLLRSILLLCPNVTYLDVSDTPITDATFKGLKYCSSCTKLQYLNISGCVALTDLGMFRLADSLAILPPYLPDCREVLRDVYLADCDRLICGSNYGVSDIGCCCEIEDSGSLAQMNYNLCIQCQADEFCESVCKWKKNGVMCQVARLSEQCPYVNSCQNSISLVSGNNIKIPAEQLPRSDSGNVCSAVNGNSRGEHPAITLKHLDISGCFEITDEGLRCLAEAGLFSHLEYLDISGCWRMSGEGLCEIVTFAPKLLPENLFYCSNIEKGPFPDSANGCQNLESNYRACCRVWNLYIAQIQKYGVSGLVM